MINDSSQAARLQDKIPAYLFSELQSIKEKEQSCTLMFSGDTQFSPYYGAVIKYIDAEVIQFTCSEQTANASTIQQYTYRIELIDGVGITLASIPSSESDDGNW